MDAQRLATKDLEHIQLRGIQSNLAFFDVFPTKIHIILEHEGDDIQY